MQQTQGDRAGAKESFLQAIRADPKFALPLIRIAALEATQGDWRGALDHSQKAIDLNPAALPNAYALNAMANVSLQNADAAEKSARQGLKLDTEHQYPELQYSLGVVLYSKGQVDEAKEHLQAYVDHSPNATNAVVARDQLAQMKRPPVAPAIPVTSTNADASKHDENPSPNTPVSLSQSGSSLSPLLRTRNAELLVKTPLHTCLESIGRAQIDIRGQMHGVETVRFEIAVSEGKEIYAQAGGKRFENAQLADMLGRSFSTTGLFSSIARALIAGNDVSIEPAGDEILHGEPVSRYNFRVLPGASGWSIQYGKDSGQAGEEGWFMVSRDSLILRRVSVHAIDIPQYLKLKNVRAVIDYETVTIADRHVLLPVVAQVTVEEKSGTQRASRFYFNHCHVFGAESSLSFDVDAAHGQSVHALLKSLPPDLNIAVVLGTLLSQEGAASNDVVMASVAQPVLSNGREIVARGAAVEGHVRTRRGENGVVIELDRVQTADGWVPFYARLASLPSSPQARIESDDPGRVGKVDEFADLEIPGVAKITFVNKPAELPAGTLMNWKTETLIAPTAAREPRLGTSVELR